MELGPEGDRPVAGACLEAAMAVGAKAYQCRIKAHVLHVQAEHLGRSSPREQERSNDRVQSGGGVQTFLCLEHAGGLEKKGCVRDLEEGRLGFAVARGLFLKH